MPKSQPKRCIDFRTLGLKDLRTKVEQLYQKQTKQKLSFDQIVEKLFDDRQATETFALMIGKKFKNLHTLELPRVSANRLAVILDLFTHCSSKLTHLKLRRSEANDYHLFQIGVNFSSLNHLELSNCHMITDVGLRTMVSMLKDLSYLDIKEARWITKHSLQYIGELQKKSLPPRLSCLRA